MTNMIHSLETCWYISPPWGKDVPPILVSLLEKVYIPNPRKIVGYCCGIEWLDEGWRYSIASERGIISVDESELTVTGQILPLRIETPVFTIGELVKFQFGEGSKIRTVLGLQIIKESCFYKVEWHSPALTTTDGSCAFPKADGGLKLGDAFSFRDATANGNPNGIRFAYITQFDLTKAV
ncbi:DUF1392 family protein [Aulosira sp. FACHB-615]|uniref:DUF1392 family protein n=1 Tax=Aulosira sp. FACHB-615 TaxID=2692777 RepID=UPI001684C039|nr:DUF1392 family protein [Aulosira sp. FACHB-615]MBD2492635.1 DUF1392 family protein [Aulosira sp. FACHB-615]